MTTQQNDPEVLNELMRREPIFHRPESRTTCLDFENMTEETFWEVGASGGEGHAIPHGRAKLIPHPFVNGYKFNSRVS